jgi:hypothetical protein
MQINLQCSKCNDYKKYFIKMYMHFLLKNISPLHFICKDFDWTFYKQFARLQFLFFVVSRHDVFKSEVAVHTCLQNFFMCIPFNILSMSQKNCLKTRVHSITRTVALLFQPSLVLQSIIYNMI